MKLPVPNSPEVCCLCFTQIDQDSCMEDAEGVKWDLCRPCGEKEAYALLVVLMSRWLG